MADSGDQHSVDTRRGLLRRGLAIGLAAPIVGLASQVATAWADGDDPETDDKPPSPPPHPPRPRRPEPFTSDLITVSDAASSGDFVSGNAGSDPLTDGRITMQRRPDGANEGLVAVELRGATPNAVYQVFFQPFSGSARQDLGTIGPTNKDGNLNARGSTELSGTNRVGIFVIARSSDGSGQAGKDEFVSSIGG